MPSRAVFSGLFAPVIFVVTLLFGVSAAGLAVLQSESQAAAQNKKDAENERTIRALIQQLGDASFEARDAAAKKLKAIGEPVLDLLEKSARESKDPELRNNAEMLVRDI